MLFQAIKTGFDSIFAEELFFRAFYICICCRGKEYLPIIFDDNPINQSLQKKAKHFDKQLTEEKCLFQHFF